MQTLSFQLKMPYRYDSDGRYGPFVDVGLLLNGSRYDVRCLLDTGAERTVLDGLFLRAAGIDVFSGIERYIGGFLRSSVVVHEHVVTLVMEGFELTMPVLFSTHPLERAVVGRDILAEFQLGLRERVGEIFLDREN